MSAPLRVLIVEDLESDAALVIRQLRKAGGDVEALRVETAVEMRAALGAQAWDVVIADYRLPHFDAPGALAVLQETGLDLPFIVVSGTVGEDVAVAMMKAGAHDYLMKDKLARLVPAIEREMHDAQSRRERRRAQEALRASDARFAAVFHGSPLAIALSRLGDGTFVDVNEAWTRLTGVSREQAIGATAASLDLWVDPAQRDRLLADTRESGSAALSEVRLRDRSGNVLDLLMSAESVELEGAAGLLTMAIDISERKRAEAALQESELRYRSLFENMLNGVAYCQMLFEGDQPRDFINVAVNRAFETMTGLSNVVGRRVSEVIPGIRETDPGLLQIFGRVARTGVPERFETHVAALEMWFSVAVYGLGKDHFVLVFETITERKWAEQVLRDSERTHRELVENLNDVVFTMNVAGRFDYVSPAAERVLGRPAAEIAGHHYSAFIHADDRNAAALAFREAFDGRVYPCEFRFEVADGEYRWVRASTRPLVVAGQVDGLSGVLTDITERKQAEDALRTSESFLNSVIDQSPHPTWVSDDKGILLRLNQACRDLLHVTDEEVVGKYNVLKDSVVEQSGAMPLVRRVYEVGETARFELDYDSSLVEDLPLARSAHVVLAVTISPIRDGAGKITNAVIQHTDITERRRAERALRESEEHFRRVFEQAAVGMSILSPSGEWLQINQRLCEILGYSRDELMRHSFRGITHPDDLERDVVRVREMAAGPRSFDSWEKRYIHKDGHVIWARVTSSLFRSEDGRPQYFVAVTEDVTERRRAEEQLRHERDLLDRLLTTVPDFIYFKDRESRFVRINVEQARRFGLNDPNAAVGKTDFDFFGAEHAQQAFADEQRIMATGEPLVGIEEKETWLDGGITWVSTTKVPLRDGAGQILGLVGVSRDVTAHRQMEQELRSSEERFRMVFEAVTDGILLANAENGRLVMANKAMCRMLGYSEEELLRLAVDDIHPPADLSMVKDVLQRQLTGERPLAKGIPVQRKDGSTFIADIHGLPLTLSNMRCVLGVFRDMTAFNEMEQQLRQAQKMEAIGQLAGGVAHDFNNILCVIQGHAELMLRGLRDDDPLFRSATQIQSSGERAAALTRQLLAFSRKQALQPVVIDLNATVRNLESMLRRLIGEDVDFATTLAADLGRVKADPGQIEQVIVNLAVNARDAMPQGGRLLVETVNVEVDGESAGEHAHVAPGAYAMLAITDTGTGMDQRTQERLFEPFFTTKEIGKGTGLGLSTVYGIVKQSGGHIWVESELGRGSTFRIYLPRTEEAVAAGATRSEGGPLRGAGERILVVEDEAELREIVREVLDDLGYRTTAAANGGEALLAVEEGGLELELLITDVVMPGMSGPLLAERLRRTRPELKVLFMSGYTDAAVARRGLLEPGTPFLQKPFKTEDLASKIWWTLRGDKPGR